MRASLRGAGARPTAPRSCAAASAARRTGIQRGTAQSLGPARGTLSFDELAVASEVAGHARSTAARSYHWRARVATSNPLFPHTAWFGLPESSLTEAKLRTPVGGP